MIEEKAIGKEYKNEQLAKISVIIYSSVSLLATTLFTILTILYSTDYYVKPEEFLNAYIPEAELIILISQLVVLPIVDIFIVFFRQRKIGRITAIIRLALYFVGITISLVLLMKTDWNLWQDYPGLASKDIPLLVSRNILPLIVNIPLVISILLEKQTFKQWLGIISTEKGKQIHYIRLFNFIFFLLTYLELVLVFNLIHFNVIDVEDVALQNFLIISTAVYFGWFILSELIATRVIFYSKEKQAKKLDDE